MNWQKDIADAPKGEQYRFLVKLPNGLVTTAYFYWYTERGHEMFRRVAYWALQDAIRDEPLDEAGPVNTLGLEWMPIP